MKNNTEPQLPSLSHKEFVVLALLIGTPKRDKYGLELVNMSQGLLKPGTIYVTLSRMQNKGYVESHVEESPVPIRGIPRRLYRATGLGEEVYRAWTPAESRIFQNILNPEPA